MRSATRSRVPAHWASWADSLRMIHARHPGVADTMVRCLVGPTELRHFNAAASCRAFLRESGFDTPEWEALLISLPRAVAAFVPGALAIAQQGWQHDASLAVEQRFVNTMVLPRASPAHRAMLRSQGGPLSGLPFTTLPLSPLQRFDSHLFRVLLLRRLHLPLPLSSRACRCGRPLDCLGHHRASCSRAGVLGRRGFALESAVARVCREAGARVSMNVFLRDLDLPIGAMDQRRIEVIAEGLPVFHGAQLAIDATLVSPLRADGEPHRRCPDRRRQERTYPELTGGRSRARLVVIAAETGGRFSEETQTLLRLLAGAKTRSTPKPLRIRARQSWLHRWGSLLSCVLLLGRSRVRCWVSTATRAPMATRPLSQT